MTEFHRREVLPDGTVRQVTVFSARAAWSIERKNMRIRQALREMKK